MIANIRSEMNMAVKRKFTRWYALGIVALVLIANIAVVAFRIIYGANAGTYAYNLLEYATWCFVIPYYSCILIADIVFGNEAGYLEGAKEDSSKVARFKVYLSKLVTALALGAVYAVFAIIALVLITTLFQIRDARLSWYSISDFLGKFAIALPLWYAGVSFGMMFLFVFSKKRYAYIAYFVLTLLIPRVIMMFAAEPFLIHFFRIVRSYTLTQNFSLIPYPADPSRNVVLTIVLGLVYGTVSNVIGCIACSKKKYK